MTILLDDTAIDTFIDTIDNDKFVITPVVYGSLQCPITDKHVELAMDYFSNNYVPGKPFDFRALSRMSACRDDGGNRDFTADGVIVGQKLSPQQVKYLFDKWLAECEERFPIGE